MQQVTTPLLFLIIGLVLLWLAVTGRIGQLLDAVDVATGKKVATAVGGAGSGSGGSLPALPALPPQ